MDIKNSKILIVDDTKSNIDILLESLGMTYDIFVAMNGEEALEAVSEELPDLILLDVMMPVMDGYEVCKILKKSERTKDIPIIFLSAIKNIQDKTKAFELGAVDYITKPFEITELKARVKNHLELKFAKIMLKNQKDNLEILVKERTKELLKTRAAMIYSLSALAETRDVETGEHIKRTQYYMKLLALTLRKMNIFTDYLTNETIDLLFESAPLHDIGKVGVPDNILLKKGRLTKQEFEIMKKHTIYGMKAIETAEKELGKNSFLKLAKEIAYTHHEKWDGTGYPRGLKGEEIPISGRMMAIVDVYDALISERVYKEAYTHEKSKNLIIKEKGKHFDPIVVEAFLKCEEEFYNIKEKFNKNK
ncbi:MAG: two-component system response regulator [Peptostreptococcaceae bacterium]|jgi:putative two-component system response regulator|nr:two-component system response regulator [Peptostreptococcaceae bacterium]